MSGCATRPAAKLEPPQDRAICGWEELSDPPQQPFLRLPTSGSAAAALGHYQITVQAEPSLPVAAAKRALEPLYGSLLRLKLVARKSWLLSLTIVQPRLQQHVALRSGQAPSQPSVVGDHRIVRVPGAPVARYAQVRLDGGRLRLLVEGADEAGRSLSTAVLAETLRGYTPPIEVFSLSASDATRWQQLLDALVAMACFDRKPGQEPHEVLWNPSP